MTSSSPPAHRREARIALSMLPIGAVVTTVSTFGVGAVLVFAGFLLATGPAWTALAWCLAAVAVGSWNIRAGIGMMSAFDWRPLPLTVLLSAAVMAGWLYLP